MARDYFEVSGKQYSRNSGESGYDSLMLFGVFSFVDSDDALTLDAGIHVFTAGCAPRRELMI
jgi:hypothetical protein